MNQKAVIFDVGRVLIEWDMHLPFRAFMDEPEIVRMIAETDLAAWNLRFDAGLSFAAGMAELSAQFPHYAEVLQAFDTNWVETTPQAIHGSVSILERLIAAGVPVYGITNFSSEKWPIACTRYPFLATSFIDVVVSGDEGVIKPDAEIFNRLLGRNNLAAADCVFIDDSPKNVSGAQAVGIDAILFTTPEKLAADLTARGLLLEEADR